MHCLRIILLLLPFVWGIVSLVLLVTTLCCDNSNLHDILIEEDRKVIVFYDSTHSRTELENCSRFCVQEGAAYSEVDKLSSADAVVFYPLCRYTERKNFYWRRPHQRFVYWALEAPTRPQISGGLEVQFWNWTITYRRDGDIRNFLENDLAGVYDHLWSLPTDTSSVEKKGLIVWFVSHCGSPSRREQLAVRMQQLMPTDSIHVFGACTNRAPTAECVPRETCHSYVERYKFYLAFENSICTDYVTEKVWHRIAYESVPIVLFRAVFEATGLPAEAVIAVDDFADVRALVNYLLYLDANPDVYTSKHLQWRHTFMHAPRPSTAPSTVCQLCMKLWDNAEPIKTYENFSAWYAKDCFNDFVPNFLSR